MKFSLKEYPFDQYGYEELRVIDDTDCAAEADDAFALAHVLLTSKFDVKAVTAANFEHQEDSVQRSYDAICGLVDAMGLAGQVNILHGGLPMKSEEEYEESDASRFIVEEAMRDDPRPLYVVAQGALTNVAVALKTKPEIARRMHCIWIGGGAYPKGGHEFNLFNDLAAARIVFKSEMPLWQVPANVYAMTRVSFMTLYQNLKDCGKAGAHLLQQLWDFNKKYYDWRMGGEKPKGSPELDVADAIDQAHTTFGKGEAWQLGDSPVVGLLLNAQAYDRDEIGAPDINDDETYRLNPDNPRKIMVYKSIDTQFIFNDFFDKMKYQYEEK